MMMEYAVRPGNHTVFTEEKYCGRHSSAGGARVNRACRSGMPSAGRKDSRKRRLRAFRRVRLLLLTFVISAVSLICLSGFTNSGAVAGAGTAAERHKYYTAVYIDRDTTLWSIASEYMTEDYPSMKAYIGEVREINGISGDTIYYGSSLIVPYYSSDLY